MSQLYQRETWTTRDGETKPISELGTTHIKNILKLIDRAAPGLLERCIQSYICGPYPSGDMAQDAFDLEFDWLLDMSPQEYVDGLPVVEALRSELAHRITRATRFQIMTGRMR